MSLLASAAHACAISLASHLDATDHAQGDSGNWFSSRLMTMLAAFAGS